MKNTGSKIPAEFTILYPSVSNTFLGSFAKFLFKCDKHSFSKSSESVMATLSTEQKQPEEF